jgi:hypothetical protein
MATYQENAASYSTGDTDDESYALRVSEINLGDSETKFGFARFDRMFPVMAAPAVATAVLTISVPNQSAEGSSITVSAIKLSERGCPANYENSQSVPETTATVSHAVSATSIAYNVASIISELAGIKAGDVICFKIANSDAQGDDLSELTCSLAISYTAPTLFQQVQAIPGATESSGVVTCLTHRLNDLLSAFTAVVSVVDGISCDVTVGGTNYRIARISDSEHTIQVV